MIMEPSNPNNCPAPLTDWEADVLRHTSDTGRYVTDEKKVIELGERGLLNDYGPQRLADGMHYFTLALKGQEALQAWRDAKPQPPKISRKKAAARSRYQEYLRVGDIYGSFHQWLKHKFPKKTP